MQQLSAATLSSVRGAAVPVYDRGRLSAGVVHLGVGGFSRAHQAVYLDRLLGQGATEWAVCGVGTQPLDRRMNEVLTAQDGLYTVVERRPDGGTPARVVGALLEHLFAPGDPLAVVERLASPVTQVVTLTITEGGYPVDPHTGRFAPVEAGVLLDLQPGAVPATPFGLVVEALARRRSRGTAPFTIVSCDNVVGNGHVAREAFTGFATRRDPGLGAWISDHVAFPSSMVDRITPVTTDDDRAAVAEQLGVRDGWPVVCEPYSQWVLEDAFGGRRPPLEDVGVQVVGDVAPYELMKLRLLNAGHQVLGHLGSLAGFTYVDEAVADPLLRALLVGYLEREATPTLPPVPGTDLAGYRRSLLERFGNPHVRDTLARLGSESSDRIPTFVLPVVREQLARGGEIERSALVVAAWARYAEGVDEQGRPIPVVDRQLETVRAAAERSRQEPSAFLTETGLFGDLAQQPDFVAAYTRHLERLHRHGVRAALQAVLAGRG